MSQHLLDEHSDADRDERTGAPEAGLRVLRFIPEVRSASVEMARGRYPSTTAYLRTRADFDGRLDPESLGFVHVPISRLVPRLLTTDYDVVQVPDPLWYQYVPHTLAVLTAVRLRDRLRRRRTMVVAYGFANALVTQVPAKVARIRAAWVWAFARAVRLQVRMTDRIAFASPGAEAAVRHALGRGRWDERTEFRVFEVLLAPCACPPTARDATTVAFVTGLERRKGLLDVLAAWPSVVKNLPGARLVVAGSGPLEAAVRQAAEQDPSIEVRGLIGRTEVHELYRRAGVVVMPSLPDGGWREQVGRAIVEGPAHGCRVVTTDQTGLAAWLERSGQYVVPTGAPVEQLVDALTAALQDAEREPVVTYDLPSRDGAHLADDWLYRAVSSGSAPV